MAVSGDPLLWLGTIVLGVATAYVAAAGARQGDPSARLAVVPPLVGALAYLLAALGVGGTAGGLALTRYGDWVVTAPLLLAVLGVAGRATGAALWGALASAAVMALAGLALGVAGLAGTAKLGAVAVVWLAMVVALALLYVPVSRRAGQAGNRRARLFSMLRNLVPPVFVGYALVMTLAPAGLGVVGAGGASAGLFVVDLLGKATIPVVLARNVGLLE